MHFAYFSACACEGLDEPDGLEAGGALDWAVVVVLPRLATPLCTGVPPQAAARTTKVVSKALSATGRVVGVVTFPIVARAC
jgi:hypothetical protein